jgi:hypothetical protein
MQHLLYAVLPIGAIFALASGPSTAAAYAECRARVAQEQRDKQKNSAPGQEKTHRPPTPSPSSGGPGKRPERHSAEAVFVAPLAAKPSNGETWQFESSADHRPECDFAPPRLAETFTTLTCDPIAELHRPAYLAQAPPP